jgi:hypothetical protein
MSCQADALSVRHQVFDGYQIKVTDFDTGEKVFALKNTFNISFGARASSIKGRLDASIVVSIIEPCPNKRSSAPDSYLV